MPCTLEPWEQDYEATRIRRERGGDDRSDAARLDRYRELILDLVSAIEDTAAMDPYGVVASVISYDELQKIRRDQFAHRRADLDRLIDAPGLTPAQRKAVKKATPTRPLAQQLDFDPDAF